MHAHFSFGVRGNIWCATYDNNLGGEEGFQLGDIPFPLPGECLNGLACGKGILSGRQDFNE